jgi:hypothetical protein
VKRHAGCPGISVTNSQLVDVLNHQMNVNWRLGNLNHAFDHGKTKGQIWNKVTVHNIYVNRVGFTDRLKVSLKVNEVGREDARVDGYRHC